MLGALAFHNQVVKGLQDAYLVIRSYLSEGTTLYTHDDNLYKTANKLNQYSTLRPVRYLAEENNVSVQDPITLDGAIEALEDRIANRKKNI